MHLKPFLYTKLGVRFRIESFLRMPPQSKAHILEYFILIAQYSSRMRLGVFDCGAIFTSNVTLNPRVETVR